MCWSSTGAISNGDSDGQLTLGVNGKLHHIGVARTRPAGTTSPPAAHPAR
jgi:hypothetical protein